MGKRARTLITIMIIFIIILIPLISLKFTGYLVKEEEKIVKFYFQEEKVECPLNGYVFIGNKPVGKSENGYFDLTYSNYITNMQNSNERISLFGKLGKCSDENSDLYFDKYWEIPEINDEQFLGESLFTFKTQINSNNPSKRELQGFIQPQKINSELNKISLNDNLLTDLSRINRHLNDKIDYKKDWDFNGQTNYWQIPSQTLEIKTGDCEDYSTVLLSLFSAYNPNLNCYNIIFESHVTTFCYFEDYYAYYDQERTELIKNIPNHNSKTKSELEKLNNDYFEHYGINDSESKVHYAFNDLEYFEFETNEDFINWQINIKNKKENANLFEQIENEMNKNLQELPEIDLKTGELRTQTISLPNSNKLLYIIIPIAAILLVILIILLIKVIRK